jgi:hypothetical protein
MNEIWNREIRFYESTLDEMDFCGQGVASVTADADTRHGCSRSETFFRHGFACRNTKILWLMSLHESTKFFHWRKETEAFLRRIGAIT